MAVFCVDCAEMDAVDPRLTLSHTRFVSLNERLRHFWAYIFIAFGDRVTADGLVVSQCPA